MARPVISLRVVLNTIPRSTHQVNLRGHLPQIPSSSRSIFQSAGIRTYATHKSTKHPTSTSEATSELLRNGGSARRATEGGPETVGPFPLGVGASGRRKAWRPWGELGIGGKLVRSTQQTGNLAVILVGGTLFVILTLALTTELFAKNSPSVLYSQAVDMIRDSDALNPHLLPPLTFTHSPHSSAPVRGSAPIPHTFIKHPKSGREHMLLTFWIHGRGKDEPEQLGRIKSIYRNIEDYGRKGLIYVGLINDSTSDLDTNQDHIGEDKLSQQRNVQEGSVPQQGIVSRWFGGFTNSLRGNTASGTAKKDTRGLPPPGTYKIGECRAEYVKNASGTFTLLSLFVDIPSSTVAYPSRVVIHQSPEAATEGLIGTRIR
ncbi:uncharacterized protein IL334_002644 [Kwoniella shivajii]|uniref:Mitochondrial import inner membrane translocase subunit Tim21 n=1 Tax=Kwoniella shivajii TaxID=564305 RepID=A0ABZ1CVY4_9TREE|nr:hypothetical protein IL334_002644 [Kwoniella shivajii]